MTLRDLRASSDRGLRTLRPSLREEMMSLDDVLLLVKEVEDMFLTFELDERKESIEEFVTLFRYSPGLFSIVDSMNYWQKVLHQHHGQKLQVNSFFL